MSELVLPGIPNIHSHSFQRAMAGMAERGSERADSFWTWRELMYRFAGRLTPESLHDISAQLFVEMLQAGYTSTCEFHYLHHQADGRPYDDPAAMSRAIIAAARETGIRLTLLPVLYMTGGFDGRELSDRQQRFGHDVDAYLSLLDALTAQEDPMLRVGVALHSLRAVPADAMREVLAAPQVGALRPIHIHISEQTAEVEECIAARGARPVEWLLANAAVDEAWTLVHATHVQASELSGIAASKAVVALCPTTEANLGDGVFPLREFIARGGRIGIGSDSNVSVSPVEELRWLEYGQRLVSRQRNIAATRELPSSGESLVMRAVAGGRQSNGHGEQDDDLLVLDEYSASMCGVSATDLHDRFVFGGNVNPVKDVFVQGRRIIESGRHVHGERINQRFRDSMRRLLSDS